MKTLKKMLAVLVVAMLLMTSAISAMAAVSEASFVLTLTTDHDSACTGTQKMEVATTPYVKLSNNIVDGSGAETEVCFSVYEVGDLNYGPDPSSDTRITDVVCESQKNAPPESWYQFVYLNGYGTSTNAEDRYYMFVKVYEETFSNNVYVRGTWNV